MPGRPRPLAHVLSRNCITLCQLTSDILALQVDVHLQRYQFFNVFAPLRRAVLAAGGAPLQVPPGLRLEFRRCTIRAIWLLRIDADRGTGLVRPLPPRARRPLPPLPGACCAAAAGPRWLLSGLLGCSNSLPPGLPGTGSPPACPSMSKWRLATYWRRGRSLPPMAAVQQGT